MTERQLPDDVLADLGLSAGGEWLGANPSLERKPEPFNLFSEPQEVVPSRNNPLLRVIRKSYPEPVVVPVVPESDAVASRCWENISRVIERAGGSMVTGRIVWTESKNHWLHLEAHALWRKPDGSVVDITPKADGETEILFVPEELTYAGYAIPCKYVPDHNRWARDICAVFTRLSEIRCSIPVDTQGTAPPEYFQLQMQSGLLWMKRPRR